MSLIDVQEAQKIVLQRARPLKPVRLSIYDAGFLTLARPVCTDTDQPPFDRAMMDGYAVRAGDCSKGDVTLEVVDQVAAGYEPTRELRAGEAIQINTGAPVPNGADCVVQVEKTELIGNGPKVVIADQPRPGQHIGSRGEFAKAGDEIVSAGTCLGPAETSAVAACGCPVVEVFPRPRVAILATGDELVEIGASLKPGQIRNSNSFALKSLVEQSGCEPVDLGIAVDDRTALETKFREGLQADVFCLSGGVSAGEFDFVPEVLEKCGVNFHIRKVAVKPGKPLHFGTTSNHKYVFALPGNPVSVLVCFWVFVRPLLMAIQGRSEVLPPFYEARMEGRVARAGPREEYRPARMRCDGQGALVATPQEWHGSGDIFGVVGANGLIRRAPHAAEIGDGATVQVLAWGPVEYLGGSRLG